MNKEKSKQQIKVFVALSGGVDSAVSAALLQYQGYDVTGVFMKNWSGDNYGIQDDCPWEQDQADAENVCDQLEIPFRSYNLEKEYREKVVKYFFDEIKAGRTPNPDVMCNKEIKFGIFLQKAIEQGADYIATGHYVRKKLVEDKAYLLKGLDPNKDQSYFLNSITQEMLRRSMFPIGEFQKSKVRELARELKLPVSDKPDSQGICFIGEIDVKEFLRANIQTHQGKIIDLDTDEALGTHDGIEFYTIGQREGLGIGGASEPYFVVDKDKENNILYVAMGKKNQALFKNEVNFCETTFISNIPQKTNLTAAIRYRQRPGRGKLDLDNNKFIFDTPQRAVAEGQSIVFYDGDICLGGAIITGK